MGELFFAVLWGLPTTAIEASKSHHNKKFGSKIMKMELQDNITIVIYMHVTFQNLVFKEIGVKDMHTD